MMNESLIELCLHLPSAIENKKTFEIKKFKKIAEKLSEEMKIARDDVQMELEDISTDSQLEILPADMNSKILPGTSDGNVKKICFFCLFLLSFVSIPVLEFIFWIIG